MKLIKIALKKWEKWWKFVILLLLLMMTFTYAMFQGGFVSWFLFYSFLPFALFALMIFTYSLNDFTVERVLGDQELIAGDPAVMKIIIKRNIPIPIAYLLIHELLPERLEILLGREKISSIVFPGFKKRIELSYTIKSMPRGEHAFNKLEIRTGDILGLIEKSRTVDSNKNIIVLPVTVPLPLGQVLGEYEQGKRTNSYKIRNETAMVSGIRDYAPGDRMTVIDWKSSAKGVGLKTKNFEEKQSSDFFLLINCESDHSIFEEMITFSASIAEIGLMKGMKLGLWAGGAGTDNLLEVKEGKGYIQKALNFLAKIQASSKFDRTSPRFYTPQTRFIPPNASLIVVTSVLHLPFIKAYTNLAGGTHSLYILFFCDSSHELNKAEQEAYTFGINHGAKMSIIRNREDWRVFEERGVR